MLDHHRATIDRTVEHFRARGDVLAVLVGGSIAHGFATATSDVDLLLLVSDADWERRLADGAVTELDLDSPTYDGGYVDAKYTSMGFLRDVAARGSEPARFAFDGVIVAWSRLDGLDGLDEAIRAAARYPAEGREERIRAFHAQLSYWHWMAREANRTGNTWLRGLAGPNVVVFAARLIMAHNAVLYPGYKWLLRVLREVPEQPPGLRAAIDAVIADPDLALVDALVTCVREFRDWGVDAEAWGARFMLDTELAWMHGRPAIADL